MSHFRGPHHLCPSSFSSVWHSVRILNPLTTHCAGDSSHKLYISSDSWSLLGPTPNVIDPTGKLISKLSAHEITVVNAVNIFDLPTWVQLGYNKSQISPLEPVVSNSSPLFSILAYRFEVCHPPCPADTKLGHNSTTLRPE